MNTEEEKRLLAKAKHQAWRKLYAERERENKKRYYRERIAGMTEEQLAAWRKASNEKSLAWHEKHPRTPKGRPHTYNTKSKEEKDQERIDRRIEKKQSKLKPRIIEPFLNDLPGCQRPYFRQGVEAIMDKYHELLQRKILNT